MISLNSIKDNLQEIILVIPNTNNIEFAIFSNQCTLVTCTKDYLKKKGTTVHEPSLKEVMALGNVLVNNPGHMPSCVGCRFKNNCPATIEILQCIKINDQIIGILAMTSFTTEGHDLISSNIDKHLNILNQVSELISMITVQFNQRDEFTYLDSSIELLLQNDKECKFIVNKDGYISHHNSLAMKLFSHCNLYTNSISVIFPEDIVNEILSNSHLIKKHVNQDHFSGLVSSSPIITNGEFLASVVTIEQRTKKKTSLVEPRVTIDNILGNSDELIKLKSDTRKISKSSSTVLISGETGTGKELFAKAIHYGSPRANAPLVSINCASIPENLFESELFGYEEGAFTGAKKGGKIGRIELAQNGTLFLDEIGELPLFMQSKLLRVLQENVIEKIGGTHSIPVDIRFVVATNKNLEEMVENNTFRSDLYYRLNVIPLKIPPLNKRKEDIEILSQDFLREYNFKLNRKINGLSDETKELLIHYDWPGNVRELENAIEYAVNMEESKLIQKENLPDKILHYEQHSSTPSMKKKIECTEYETIKMTLDKYGWDVKGKTEAAKELGIGLRTLYRKIKSFE